MMLTCILLLWASLQTLMRDRLALSDALLGLCRLAGMPAEAADSWEQATAGAEAGPGQLLDLLRSQVQVLQDQLAVRSAELTEVQAAHEEAATQLVARQVELEAAQEALGEQRHVAREAEGAAAALAHKLGLLEGQLAAESSSARRRMEQQLDSFRGDAASARDLRSRLANAEQQLELAQRAARDEGERAATLVARGERLRGALKEAGAKAAGLAQQLLEATAARGEAEARAREAADQAAALTAANRGLQAALVDHKERALLADSLAASLKSTQEAATAAQGAAQAEMGRRAEELLAVSHPQGWVMEWLPGCLACLRARPSSPAVAVHPSGSGAGALRGADRGADRRAPGLQGSARRCAGQGRRDRLAAAAPG